MEWTLAGIVRRHAEERGAAPMITYGDRVIAWAEMHERSSRVAQALAAEGVGPGDRIAFIDKNGPEYFEVLFGGGKANAVNVAVNWRLVPREMEYTVNDAQAKVLVVGPDFVGHLEEIESSLTTVKKVVVIGGHARHEGYDDWVGRHPAEDTGVTAAPDDVAIQLYTSGTTGLPKGVMLTNTNLGALVPQVSPQWSLDATSVNLVAMPLFHIGGSGWALVGMWNGAHSILVREFVPTDVLDVIERNDVTNALLVPAMLQFLSAIPGAAERDFSRLRSIVYGASPITNEVLVRSMRTFHCDFIQVYGLTETTGAVTQLDAADHDPDGPRANLLRSAGKAYPWVEIRIVGGDGEDVAPGQVGELWIRSVQVMKGYWNKPEETAKAITPDGWFKSGDAGFVDPDGFVFLTDRVKDMIVSGGENVYPAEVENALSGHPAVADVAVIGVPDDRWGETVKAIVVAKEGADVASAEVIIAYARERLARYKCPTSVDFVAELPRNPSGKILKRELREPFWAGKERRIN